ncbi:MAG: M28 family peptidase [Bacteroidales bacterium]|nr:M28 family peptidase [Bacteroidales bacterium]
MSKIINRGIVAVLLAIAIPLCGTAQERDTVPMPKVNIDSIMKHIVELSSETYEGRLAGSQGYNRAMGYVERELSRLGAKPMDVRRGEPVWELPFALECNEVENAKFNVYRPGSKEKRVFSLGNEFCCAGATGRGYVDAQLVFCGYGIDNTLYNEYDGVDTKGKIVVVLTGLPAEHPLPQSVADRYVSLRDKARAAERHGAIGMLVVTVTPTCPDDEPQGRAWCGELPHMPTFPVLILSHDCGREIFMGEQMELDAAIATYPHSFSLLKKAEIDINARYSPQAQTANVVGILEGSDAALSRELIVVGASMDGLGIQGGTCLFPGADINASGVAAVLEVARVLSDPEYRPRRSVAFVLFSGSEQQYLGSRKFIPDFPKLRHVEAFVGVQNIGSGDSVVVLGGGRFPSLYEVAWNRDTVAGRQNIVRGGEKNTARGDARAFEAVGIPSLMFTTQDGMHHNHTTTDMWENIDRRILLTTTTLLTETITQLGEGLYQGRSQQSRMLR